MITILHDFDTHFWLAKTPDGWISAEDHSSAHPAFAKASLVRFEPISKASIQAVLESAVPEGYTAFLRTNIDQPLGGGPMKLSYTLALERGAFPDAASRNLSDLPMIDGFRATLQTWDGSVDFKTSEHFGYQVFHEDLDIYSFRRI